MLTYDFTNIKGPLYAYIYRCLKNDIINGVLTPGMKLPSKRTFAKNNGISTITIQNAYDQLISEGYIYTLPKRGYYVANIPNPPKLDSKSSVSFDIHLPAQTENFPYDLSNNGINPANFPFSVWSKIMRQVISKYPVQLMQPSPAGGIRLLREAIAQHLRSFRGMLVDPDQIVIGAGTEYLYGLLIQLIGKDKNYAIENPGYKKLINIYQQAGVNCRFADIDNEGVLVSQLHSSEADVAHICPNHHFPTGITMPATRRYNVLAWASDNPNRYIIEDDYDSEFRAEGRPLPTLFSIDGCEKVIYMNTFAKSLTPTIRISYMVLPVHLINRFYDKLSFQACTVSNFEQFTLASFINQGYFEKHINRMRLYYSRQRRKILELIENSPLKNYANIVDNDSGLHFLLKLKTDISDEKIKRLLLKKGVKIKALSDYYLTELNVRNGYFIFNYSNMDEATIKQAIKLMASVLSKLNSTI